MPCASSDGGVTQRVCEIISDATAASEARTSTAQEERARKHTDTKHNSSANSGRRVDGASFTGVDVSSDGSASSSAPQVRVTMITQQIMFNSTEY